MVIDKTKGINYVLHSVVDLVLSNVQYSPLKKQSENSTTATTYKRKHPQTSSKPSPILINITWNRNSKLHSRDLPVPSPLVLSNNLPLPLSSRFYPQPLNICINDRYQGKVGKGVFPVIVASQ